MLVDGVCQNFGSSLLYANQDFVGLTVAKGKANPKKPPLGVIQILVVCGSNS